MRETIGHCKDCRHFSRNGSGNTSYGWCNKVEEWHEGCLAFASASDDSGSLTVNESFGCVQFEAKDNN